MNTRLLLFLLFAPLIASADEPIAPLTLFALPKIELKSAAQTNSLTDDIPHETSTDRSTSEPTDTDADQFSITQAAATQTASIALESTISSYEAMNGSPVLFAPLPSYELGGAAGWLNENVWQPVFVPEVVKLGKVYVTGSIVTAIKRKNPFCLLSPLVFSASW